MKVGYFKVRPALPSGRKLALNKQDGLKLLALPLTGFSLAIILIGGMQIGNSLADYNLPRERYQALTKIQLPDSVFFTASVYDSILNLFGRARVTTPTPMVTLSASSTETALLREQLRQQILSEIKAEQASSSKLFGGIVPADKPSYRLLAVPTSGSSTADESLKQELRQTFADQVDIRIDSNGSSGTVTPIFPDGRRGKTYVFVLAPTR